VAGHGRGAQDDNELRTGAGGAGFAVMPDDGAGASRLRGRWLQGLFAPALAWAIFWFGFLLLGEQFEVLNPVSEGNPLHNAFEEFIPPLVAIAPAGAITALVIRFWPGFLRFPKQAALSRVLVSFLLAAPIVAIAVLIIASAVCMMLEPPPWKSDNPQYFPAVFWYAPLFTIALTPVTTVVAAWWWAVRRKTGRRGE
jgi:hypothetical protein